MHAVCKCIHGALMFLPTEVKPLEVEVYSFAVKVEHFEAQSQCVLLVCIFPTEM